MNFLFLIFLGNAKGKKKDSTPQNVYTSERA